MIHREDVAEIEPVRDPRSRVLTWQRRCDHPNASDDARSRITARSSKSSLVSAASSAMKSIARSEAPKSARSVSEGSVVPTVTQPSETGSSGLSTKAIMGTLLGAAAGAAVAYAMVRGEQDSAREETAHETLMKMRAAESAKQSEEREPSIGPRSQKAPSQAPESVYHRNISVTNSEFSAMPRRTKTQLALENAPEPVNFQDVDMGGYRQPSYMSIAPTRAPTQAYTEYIPASVAPSSGMSRVSQQQAASEYIPASLVSQRSSAVSRRSQPTPSTVHGEPLPESRQIEDVPSSQAGQTEYDSDDEDMTVERRDSAMSEYSVKSSKSRKSGHTHVSRRSEAGEAAEDRESNVSRRTRDTPPQSVVSGTSSHRSHRSRRSEVRDGSSDRSSRVSRRSGGSHYSQQDRDGSPDAASEATTVRPARSSHMSAADVSLPASRKTSVVSAAELPLPVSRRTSYFSTAEQHSPVSRKTSLVSAREYGLPESRKTSMVSGMDAGSPGSRKTSMVSAMEHPLPVSRKSSIVSAMDMPLPGSRKTSMASGMDLAPRSGSVESVNRVPLPQSRTESIIGSILGRDHYREQDMLGSAIEMSLPESRTGGSSAVGSMVGRSAPESRVDYADTVVPDDSISCVASRRHEERPRSRSRSRSKESRDSRRSHHSDRSRESGRHSEHSKASHRSRDTKKSGASSSSRKHRHHRDDEGSLPALPASEVGSTSTVTPGRYRKDSAVSMPVSVRSRSGIEKDEKKGKKSIMSAVMGR